MSEGDKFKGPWNEGTSTQLKEEWQYEEDPIQKVRDTNGLIDEQIEGSGRTDEEVETLNKALSSKRSKEVNEATQLEDMQWSYYTGA
ncbi:hypothetical protein [Niabella ginsengisoli]|uniref:CsbD family protein n=1 Tax=Niabella ginsengisoli TaxID=522298 RepID=A0ABS9SKD1_9BACT|nr:hypothetical protein [Niabella ginsengisoli]MCH5598838.1 hypothetical protein [Niabella ginsengisoli]